MKRTQTVALLATLGVASGEGISNVPIQFHDVTNGAKQIRYLTESKAEATDLFHNVDEMTRKIGLLNRWLDSHLEQIDLQGFYLLDTLSALLASSFEMIKRVFSEEEIQTTYYSSMRPFSSAIQQLESNATMIKDQLSLIKRVHIEGLTLSEKDFAQIASEIARREQTYEQS